MTACTNHGGKARRVVTAALVGVLSVGTVPMVALAAGADAVAEDGIQTLVADWSTDAKVSAAEDGKGAAFTGDLTKPVSFDQGSGKYLVPTEVTGQAGTTEIDPNEYDLYYTIPVDNDNNLDGLNVNWEYTYGDGATFKAPSTTGDITVDATLAEAYFTGGLRGAQPGEVVTPKAGSYTVQIVEKGATPAHGVGVTASFTIADSNPYAGSYAGSLVYSGSAQGVKLYKANRVEFTAAEYADTTLYKANGAELGKADSTTITDSGSYSAIFDNGDDKVTINFSVEKFDVSKNSVNFPDVINTRYYNADGFVAGTFSFDNTSKDAFLQYVLEQSSKAANFYYAFQITDITSPSGAKAFDGSYGEYTVTVAAKPVGDANYDANVTGEKTFTFSRVNRDLYNEASTGLYYGSQNTDPTDAGANNTVSINLTEGQAFDASKIAVREADGTPSYTGDALEVTYYDKDAKKTVDASALVEAGNYTVTVRVKPFQAVDQATGGNLWYGGTRSFDVVVNGNKAYGENVTFYVDGELAGTAATLEYDGTDLLSRVSARVTNPEGGSFEYGTDFDFKVTKGGEEVDSIVDAGEYNIKVNPLTFEFASSTEDVDLDLTVTPQVVNTLKDYGYNGEQGRFPANKNDVTTPNGNYPDGYVNDAVAWTGSAVEVPGVQYLDDDAKAYVTLDPSLYNVVSIKKGDKVVKEAVDEGWYTARIALSDEAKANYSLEQREFSFQVVKYNPFDDVKSPAWYASAVADAKFNNVVNGMSGTNMYAPEARISRADAVGILFNLAGGSALLDDNMYTEEGGWLTGFDDVDGNAYYAGALAWAHKAGVVNGHGGNFRPNDSITREELATMLANYAKATGDFVASDGSALAAIADGSDVSAWAQESVAWAVENEIMGNGGFVAAHTDITRAEVAAMAVNYADKF